MQTLYIFFETTTVGELTLDENDRLSFTYASNWLSHGEAFALSFALPLREQHYEHLETLAFFENLLPEGAIRRKIEIQSDLPLKDDFEFLKRFGRDCAGAIVLSPDPDFQAHVDPSKREEIPLSKIYECLESDRPLIEILDKEAGGYFSLAGAQDKMPAIFEDNRIYIPTAGAPTTHILKPPVTTYSSTRDSVFNEYFCLTLAASVGLGVCRGRILEGKIPLLIIERYDRAKRKNRVSRLHQQDLCQAQGIPSRRKYERHGGPSLAQDYNVIKEHSSRRIPDLERFLNWVAFNLIVGNNDGHSKNVSFLQTEGAIFLAPFYDLVCTAIYPEVKPYFAFSIHGKDLWQNLKAEDFHALEKTLGIRENVFFRLFQAMSEKVHENRISIERECKTRFPSSKTAAKIGREIEKRLKHFRHMNLL